MSRKPRQISSTGIYHVMLRGNNCKPVFLDDMDYGKFLKDLRRVKEQSGFFLYAYCLMRNHVHLLIKEGREPIALILKRIEISYAYYFNHKYHCIGHLFQDRFCSKTVESDAYLINLIRYISQNPVDAGMTDSPENYIWLGCAGVKADDLIDQEDILTIMEKDSLELLTGASDQWKYLKNTAILPMNDAEAEKRICEICQCSCAAELAELPAKKRDHAIRQALSAGVSIRRLSKLSGISKSTIERASKG